MSITVTGKLVEAHKFTRGIGGEAVVVFRIDGGNTEPYEAALNLGPRPEAHLAAEHMARAAVRGALCVVHAHKIGERRDHAEPAMILREVFGLRVGESALL